MGNRPVNMYFKRCSKDHINGTTDDEVHTNTAVFPVFKPVLYSSVIYVEN